MDCSIIVPVLNESRALATLLPYLKKEAAEAEIIVVDGGSTDDSQAVARNFAVNVLTSSFARRSVQMNEGARIASGRILYFVHADSIPPPGFYEDILEAVSQGYQLGRYRTQFDSKKLLLRINAWFTRFDLFICMGGDQTLFVSKELFVTTGGFDSSMKIMEEYEYCTRARKLGRYKIFPRNALISARKYAGKSWLKVQLANRKAVQLYRRNASQEIIAATYKKMLQ